MKLVRDAETGNPAETRPFPGSLEERLGNCSGATGPGCGMPTHEETKPSVGTMGAGTRTKDDSKAGWSGH